MSRNVKKCMKWVERDSKVIATGSRMPYYPLVTKKGYGSIIEDSDGNEYIDFLASAGATNTGHCHPKVVKAITDQAQELIHYTPVYMYNEPMIELAEQLIKITPGKFKKKVMFGLSGSDSNDCMIKLARAYTGRTKIISFEGAYHGCTFGSISISALSLNMRRKIGPLVPDIFHISYPDCYRCKCGKKVASCNLECLDELKEKFSSYIPPEEVAAIIMEPIAGDGGILVPPEKYTQKLYEICKENGILFAVDEVQQGFGRSGKWFSIENFGVEPDIMVLGKSIASGMPMSAVVAREEIIESVGAPAHVFTTIGNPICCRAALATIEVIKEEDLVNASKEKGEYLKAKFMKLKKKYSFIGDVRGVGLNLGIDLVKDPKTKERYKEACAKICYRAWEKGVLMTFFANNVLRIQPPLVITKEEIDRAMVIIDEAMQDFVDGKIPDEVLEVAKGW
jgi:4-aminobutyrate aminotransferase